MPAVLEAPISEKDKSIKYHTFARKDNPRKFKVKKHFQAFSDIGGVFDENEFIRMHPVPSTPSAISQIDKETYHDDLIQSAIIREAIVEVPKDTPTTPTPIGPMNSGTSGSKSLILQNADEYLKTKATRLAQAQADQKQIKINQDAAVI